MSPGQGIAEELEKAPIFLDVAEPGPSDVKGKSKEAYLPLNPSPTTQRPVMSSSQPTYLQFKAADDNFGIPKVNPTLSFSQFAQANVFTTPQRTLPPGLKSHPNPIVSTLPASDGALKGTGPAMYDGDKNKSREFMREFQLWWMQNDNNNSFKIPFQRIALFLGKMRGPKVTAWIDLMMRELSAQLITNPSL
jgi:hypothetical protein